MKFIPMHAQQLVIIQWMDSCIPKEEELECSEFQRNFTCTKTKITPLVSSNSSHRTSINIPECDINSFRF